MKYKWWIFIASGLFVIGIVLGLVTPPAITSLFSEELSALGKYSSMLAPFKLSTFIFIFIKNTLVLLLSFALSPILCLMPILALALNGWVLTLALTLVAEQKSIGFVLAGVLPHGIIEIPALVIGEAAALSLGATVIVALFKKEGRSLLLPNLRQSSKYLWIALALLLIAAAIETYITPLLIS